MNTNAQRPRPQTAAGQGATALGIGSRDFVVPQIRPWVRYWARMFDIYITALVLGVVTGVISPHALDVPGSSILFGFAVLLIWVFVESLLLSSVGVTPGKWLFKVRLVPPAGEKARFTTALSRSFKVWWRGIGIGFPVISIVTLVIARSDLKEFGATTWDRDMGFVVVHERIGGVRATVIVVAFCVFIALAAVGSIANA